MHLFDAIFFAGHLSHLGNRLNVILQTHLQTLAERQVRLGIERKTELL